MLNFSYIGLFSIFVFYICFFPTDDDFLLRFLRNAKFSQMKAQAKIDNFWTVRSSPDKGVPQWFQNLDPLDPKLSELLDIG